MKANVILFDLGGTIEDVLPSIETQRQCAHVIQQLLCAYSPTFAIPFEDFFTGVAQGFERYKQWSTHHCIELSPEEIWGKWCCKGMVKNNDVFILLGDTLADIWETCYFTRNIKPDAKSTLEGLRQAGYKLGVISNTTSRNMPQKLLRMYGIEEYFQCVLLSSIEANRKPNPSMFLTAARLLQSEPGQCIYVGDQVAKDVAGARAAGYGGVVLIQSPLTCNLLDQSYYADAQIQTLSQLQGCLIRTEKGLSK